MMKSRFRLEHPFYSGSPKAAGTGSAWLTGEHLILGTFDIITHLSPCDKDKLTENPECL